MSFEKGNFYNANDFIALKSRVKAEMNRRNGNGSLTQYGGSQYEFTKKPSFDEEVKLEHHSKIRDLQDKINSTGLPSRKESDDLIQEMAILEAKQTAFEAQPRGARSNNDCNGACTGMCVSACTTTCSGSCTGSCNGCSGCSGSCSGGCSGCSGSCSSGCSGCSGSCSGGCSGCSASCSGACKTCSFGCGNGCGGCGGCTSCNYNCDGGCASTCTGSCCRANAPSV
ncbi:hypothetical protein [Vallitalea sp.]|uniref:hypothetical protein n=1 Tax=Vallitalea sp. TaxID=1882829 RepID=UPI0025DB439A|nr:hypothetical protein [Vallitalea sp.]MCT4686094.1 hypothetical protein [Vallitalea sp.]